MVREDGRVFECAIFNSTMFPPFSYNSFQEAFSSHLPARILHDGRAFIWDNAIAAV